MLCIYSRGNESLTKHSTLQCHSCGSIVSETDNFCKTCIAPVSVAKLSELSFEDHVQLLTGLIDVLGDGLSSSSSFKAALASELFELLLDET